ncbi:peptidyl-prolyl cis-trans isomerase-like 2 [Cimex lectularius]|uniref:RING-type E3 ubiquitin-protein ligase PPIL2 n=1 Tax=Cimex lectularius TaxID=79782 RepID=A0A8I6R813_CIMLE|nr:peptidyl-prolyl cis-trans isomerase-like 2 [Cimex lectularius]
MGKRQHQKDKMYLTYTEWSTLYGGKRPTIPGQQEFRRLPFDHCCVSLNPYEHPYCDLDGNIFDLESIITYLKKYKNNPVTGKPLDSKSLIKLNFYKNQEGKVECPVTFKQLTSHSHIVAIATTGNVFSYDAVERLNFKTKMLKDLITDAPFKRSDVITLQDPANLQKFNIEKFYHVKHNLKLQEAEESDNDTGNLKTVNKVTVDILKALDEEYKVPVVTQTETPKADKFNAAHYSTGKVAAGFTSTTMAPETTHEPAIVAEDLVRYERVKKKGYVRLVTNMGFLNLELDCDVVPKTCENFIKLSQNGYYNNTIFHRSIRHFMVQGGDPTGTGTGGESYWGKPFEDEIKPHLTHTGRGVLSMANSGPNTNKSQFFITYRSCRHLDGKHTVFGKIVGGLDTLSKIEKIEVDNKDKPIEPIRILAAQVFVDPYQEADEKLNAEREEEKEKQLAELQEKHKPNFLTNQVFKDGVGKYINPKILSSKIINDEEEKQVPVKKKKTVQGYSFGSFKDW